jgi:hypothetical protein
MPERHTVGAPQWVNGTLFYSLQESTTNATSKLYARTAGGCTRPLGDGILEQVQPQGQALVIQASNTRKLIDATGKQILALDPAAYNWTNDGRLVQYDARGASVYDAHFKNRRIVRKGGLVVLGPLGRNRILISDATGSYALNVDDQTSFPIGTDRRLFLAAGSPDGGYIVSADPTGEAQLMRVSDQHVTTLPRPGPLTGFAWSRDSKWLAINSLYGGSVYNVDGGKVTDLGPFDIVSW